MSDFLSELKRRKVLHTGAAYAVAAAGVIGTSSDVGDALSLPDEAVRFIVVATLIGFPVALILAWFFEVRPEPEVAVEDETEAVPGRGRWGLVAAGGLAVMALSAVLVASGPLQGAPGVLDEGARIVIAEFESTGADSAMAMSVEELLRVDLEASPHVNVVSHPVVSAALGRMARDRDTPVTPEIAREIALRDGYPAILEGMLSSSGGGWSITARLVDAASGDVLLPERQLVSDVDSLWTAVDSLSARLRTGAGEALASVEATPPLPELTTRSLEALQLYASAWRVGGSRDGVQRAYELDSTFVASKLFRAVELFLHGAPEEQAEKERLLAEAFRERHRLTPGEQAQVTWGYHQFVTGDRGEATAALDRYLEARPEERVGFLALLGLAAYGRSDWEAAASYYRELAELDPGGFRTPWQFNFTGALMMLGDEERWERERRLVWAPGPHRRAALVMEKWSRLDSLLRADGESLVQLEPYLYPMFLSLGRGQLAQFEADTEAYLIAYERRNRRLPGLDHRPRVELIIRGDTARALDRLGAPANDNDELDHALLLAWAGRPVEARQALTAFDGRKSEAVLRDLAWYRAVVEARVTLAEGDTRGALRQARTLEATQAAYLRKNMCQSCYHLTAAHAYEALGEPDSAAVAYESYLAGSRFIFDREQNARIPWLVPLHEWLGRYYEERGLGERAMSHYEKIVRSWENADDELQPRVRAAEEALRRLGGAVGGGSPPGG